VAAAKRPCGQCGKPNAVPPARLCPTCKRRNKKASAERAHLRRVAETYGLSPDEYVALVEWSGNRCYICGRAGGGKRLAVDHDHRSGVVRGLLCVSCNHYLLGKVAHDNPDRLAELAGRAVEYLRNPPAPSILGSRKGSR